ncbi:MAG: hypothetical protein HN509_10165 [Halobacteriovoraceae bacterium]|jgi:hypothetical protein|nr:hypothetical protein [Halobacteriovoraceae bacterium]MBT5093511.1 hypothetical protein [Halobacteriovoraceae bacterium]
MKKGFLLISLLALFGGCTSINKSHMNGSIGITIQSQMEAKIDVDLTRKLTGYASGGYLFHLFQISGDNKYADGIGYNGGKASWLPSKIEAIKSAAAYNAIRTSDADVIVSPQYVIEESHWNPFYKLVKVKVTGYAGKVVSIRHKAQ